MQRTHRGSKPYKVQSTAAKGLPRPQKVLSERNDYSYLMAPYLSENRKENKVLFFLNVAKDHCYNSLPQTDSLRSSNKM